MTLASAILPPTHKTTPMMEQWEQCKIMAKKALLLFRMGDFYEAFYEDASIIAKELDLTLTARQGIPMSGVPYHSCDPYIDRLIEKGFKVAIAEQVEDPKLTKGLVKREVVRIITPGTHIGASFIPENTNNFLLSISQVGTLFGIAVVDLSTGEFKTCECEHEKEFMDELFRFRPTEIITTEKFKEKNPSLFEELRISYKPLITVQEEWLFDHKIANAALTEHFKLQHLDGFGLKGKIASINACGGLLAYLNNELTLPTQHIRKITPYINKEKLIIDRLSEKNLELTQPLLADSGGPTLLTVIDATLTPMGGRTLRNWLTSPLLCQTEICKRQDGVEIFLSLPNQSYELRSLLRHIRDLERLMMKIESGYASPRDLGALRSSLEYIEPLQKCLLMISTPIVKECLSSFSDISSLIHLLQNSLNEELPLRVSDGNIFKSFYLPKLDQLRDLAKGGKQWMANYQSQIREDTGIKTLKVSYNKIFGYYIEVSKGQAYLMPSTFQKQQTLVNSERFSSPALKEYEKKVLSAEEQILAYEAEMFSDLRKEIAKHSESILHIAKSIGVIDTLLALAETAKRYHYCRPVIDTSKTLEILEGRHPVVEASSKIGDFIPNDTILDGNLERLMLITGPNMGGKSTYIRQVALIVILAQMGSFVPAKKAHIGICDKIFTRVGANDDLSRGQSTFMVEMSETANILNNATNASLVILDEIGRGTSTYDGVAIAWSVAEYLLTAEGKQPKTLFATHYFELTALENKLAGAINYHVSVKEWNDSVVFLRKIIRGSTDKSYGIHVGRLAGLPFEVISRAREILAELEKKKEKRDSLFFAKGTKKGKKEIQLTFLPLDKEEKPPYSDIEKEIFALEIEKITPLEALNTLSRWKQLIKNYNAF